MDFRVKTINGYELLADNIFFSILDIMDCREKT